MEEVSLSYSGAQKATMEKARELIISNRQPSRTLL
jgi:hypothetical protein